MLIVVKEKITFSIVGCCLFQEKEEWKVVDILKVGGYRRSSFFDIKN